MPTFTTQPDGTAGEDARLLQADSNGKYGSDVFLDIGEYKSAANSDRTTIIKFDLSSIPSDALIITGTLSLWLAVNGDLWASNNRTLAARLVAQGRDWVEADVTWNRYNATTSWTTGGAKSDGNDREATIVGTADLETTDLAGSKHDWSITPSAFQNWINGNKSNYGFVIQSDTALNDQYRFHSSDSATAAERPQLTLTYTMRGFTQLRRRRR